MKKNYQIQVPDYLSIEQYARMNAYKGDSNFGRLVHIVSALTGLDKEEIRSWDVEALTRVSNLFADLADHHNEFHALIEWNGELYGYANIKQATLGEYIDIESMSEDLENNLHKVAAILYRPVKKHRFKTLSYAVKQKVKMLNNNVENVFDWYEVETYDSKVRKEREEDMKGFPAHILLGAVSFFLSSAVLYLNHIQFSKGEITKIQKETREIDILENLSQNIGAGGGLFTTSVNPIYYQYQETAV
tara:strand:- start:1628 stop:2365 length:738 start_codon:yes stop_codon:yes gene_type:complete